MSSKINPYEVEGKIDYDRLIKEFGINKLSKQDLDRIKKITGEELHPFLRRNIFFAHRDLKFILDEYEKGNKFFLYTGRGPSGKMHLGHLIPFVFVKWLQDKFNCEVIIQLTDDEKFLFSKKNLSLEDTRKMAFENAADILALGFDLKKTRIILNTKDVKELYPLALV